MVKSSTADFSRRQFFTTGGLTLAAACVAFRKLFADDGDLVEIALIDYSTGGSIDGTIRAADVNLSKVTDKMIVIPGHGAVGGKADLILFRDVLVGIRDKVAGLKKQGKSLEEIVAAKPGGRTDEEWGQSFMTPGAFVALVYQGV